MGVEEDVHVESLQLVTVMSGSIANRMNVVNVKTCMNVATHHFEHGQDGVQHGGEEGGMAADQRA